jgi:hypothetical protein
MKRILVVSYSQTGQLTRILHNVLAPMAARDDFEMVFEALVPRKPYPFPWTALEFTDAFAESVQEIPCPLEPFGFDPEATYDAVIVAYTVWYLSPSIPINAFLQSPQAARVMRDTPVITLIGCRNMWLLAHEKVKARIVRNQGTPAANIVLMDRAANLPGVVSIAYWMLTGRKERFLGLFPRPGIAESDIAAARRFGPVLMNAIKYNVYDGLQDRLNRMGAVTVVPAYILFEQRIHKIFNVWSRFIRRKGGPGDPARKPRLQLFRGYLLTAVFLMAPAATLATVVLERLNRDKIKTLVDHFAGNRPGPDKC